MKDFDVAVFLIDWRFGGKPWRTMRVQARDEPEATSIVDAQVSKQFPRTRTYFQTCAAA